MRIHHDWQCLEADARGASCAVGNFDGVHLGHRSVIELARRHGPLGVVTFEPHPRQVFAPDSPPFRLMNAEARASRLEKLGVEHLFELRFDRALSELTPEGFAHDVLARGLGVRHVVIGGDFRFGKGRAGGAADLVRLGEAFGFATTIAPLIATGGAEISSTAIRRALAEGHPREAAAMLGHWHRIEGPVLHGDKRGRELGFATANMSLAGLHLPKFGVYAVHVDVLSGPGAGTWQGAASLGLRPMFATREPGLEVHLLDFSGDLYGRHLSVALVEYLRPEAEFGSLGALVAQMRADCARAREILSRP